MKKLKLIKNSFECLNYWKIESNVAYCTDLNLTQKIQLDGEYPAGMYRYIDNQFLPVDCDLEEFPIMPIITTLIGGGGLCLSWEQVQNIILCSKEKNKGIGKEIIGIEKGDIVGANGFALYVQKNVSSIQEKIGIPREVLQLLEKKDMVYPIEVYNCTHEDSIAFVVGQNIIFYKKINFTFEMAFFYKNFFNVEHEKHLALDLQTVKAWYKSHKNLLKEVNFIVEFDTGDIKTSNGLLCENCYRQINKPSYQIANFCTMPIIIKDKPTDNLHINISQILDMAISKDILTLKIDFDDVKKPFLCRV